MYIWDALYGKIEFDSLTYKCMLSPEMQRLREVRLCNINSLCITGSANINRFEHSVGTAYLASINMSSKAQCDLRLSSSAKQTFIIAALLHDVANGPFGHSFEYIMEKTGFVPEEGLGDVFTDVVSVSGGAHKNTSPFETIYFGKLRSLTTLLKDRQKREISQIISGGHPLSKLISASIDLDNIDNVFRMAYHMGLSFNKSTPIKLAEMMSIHEGRVLFSKEAKPYLEEWFLVRQKVYKFLLLNPQEFAGKYMLTEAMDISFECIAQKKADDIVIKWNYIDFQLMEEMNKIKEVWIKRRTLILEDLDGAMIDSIMQMSNEREKKDKLRTYIESLELTVPIKEKGKSGEAFKLVLSDNFTYSKTDTDNVLTIKNRNMVFDIEKTKLYKVITVRYNPSQIVSRLMTGDLYYCLAIFETAEVERYPEFLEYETRITIENQLESRIRIYKDFSRLSIGIHPILDVNKTERQLSVRFFGDKKETLIGSSPSRKLLLGLFIKNEPFGLMQGKMLAQDSQKKIIDIVTEYFASYFKNGAKLVQLYEEADKYGQ